MFGSSAFAVVTEHVRDACKADYYQHCSQFSVGTDELRQCMRKVGEGLSTPCLVALVEAGEITQADIDRHNAQKGAGTAADPPGAVKMPKKPGDLKNADTKHDKKNVAGSANDGKKTAKGQAIDPKGKAVKTAKTAKPSKNSRPGKSKLSKSGPKAAIAAKGATAAKTTKSAAAKKTTKNSLAASGKSAGKTASKKATKSAKLTGTKEAAKTKKSAKNGTSKKTALSVQKATKKAGKQVAKPSAKKIDKAAEEPVE